MDITGLPHKVSATLHPGGGPSRAAPFAEALAAAAAEARRGGAQPYFEAVNVQQTGITGEQLKSLLQALHGSWVRVLRAYANPLGDAGAEAVAEWLHVAPPSMLPAEVHLSNCGISDRGFLAILAAVRERLRRPGAPPLWLRVHDNVIDTNLITRLVSDGTICLAQGTGCKVNLCLARSGSQSRAGPVLHCSYGLKQRPPPCRSGHCCAAPAALPPPPPAAPRQERASPWPQRQGNGGTYGVEAAVSKAACVSAPPRGSVGSLREGPATEGGVRAITPPRGRRRSRWEAAPDVTPVACSVPPRAEATAEAAPDVAPTACSVQPRTEAVAECAPMACGRQPRVEEAVAEESPKAAPGVVAAAARGAQPGAGAAAGEPEAASGAVAAAARVAQPGAGAAAGEPEAARGAVVAVARVAQPGAGAAAGEPEATPDGTPAAPGTLPSPAGPPKLLGPGAEALPRPRPTAQARGKRTVGPRKRQKLGQSPAPEAAGEAPAHADEAAGPQLPTAAAAAPAQEEAAAHAAEAAGPRQPAAAQAPAREEAAPAGAAPEAAPPRRLPATPPLPPATPPLPPSPLAARLVKEEPEAVAPRQPPATPPLAPAPLAARLVKEEPEASAPRARRRNGARRVPRGSVSRMLELPRSSFRSRAASAARSRSRRPQQPLVGEEVYQKTAAVEREVASLEELYRKRTALEREVEGLEDFQSKQVALAQEVSGLREQQQDLQRQQAALAKDVSGLREEQQELRAQRGLLLGELEELKRSRGQLLGEHASLSEFRSKGLLLASQLQALFQADPTHAGSPEAAGAAVGRCAGPTAAGGAAEGAAC